MKPNTYYTKHKLIGILGIIISIVFLWISFKGTNWNDFILSFQNVNYYFIIAAIVVLIASVWVRAVRWKLLLSNVGTATDVELYKATMIGYMGNNILPLKIGELLRAYAISRNTNIIFSGAFSSIIIERIVDTISLLIIVTVIFTFVPITEFTQTIAIIGLFTVSGFMLITFILFRHSYEFKNWYMKKEQHLTEKNKKTLAKYLVGFCKGIEGLWQNPNPGLMIVLSFLLWALYFAVILLCIVAFNFDISLVDMMKMNILVMTFGTLVTLIPSAPGTIGTYQAATIAALQIMNINIDTARAFAVISHLVQFIPYTIIGLYYFLKLNLHIADLEDL